MDNQEFLDKESENLLKVHREKIKKINEMFLLWETSKSEIGIGTAEKIFNKIKWYNGKIKDLIKKLSQERKTEFLLQLNDIIVSQNHHLEKKENWVGKLSEDIKEQGPFYKLLIQEKTLLDPKNTVIIGAGIAGLSVAYHLLKKGIKTIVIEKNYVGSGATSKSSGLLCASAEWDLNELIEEVGEKGALQIWSINLSAIRLLVNFIIQNNINCNLRELNSISLAITKDDIAYLEEEAELRKAQGLKAEFLDKKNFKKIINTEKFYAGLYSYSDYLINSKSFIEQFGNLLRNYGVKIIENTKALKIDKKNKTIITNKGDLRYDKLVLANNYHSMDLGFFRNLIPPIRVFTADSYPLSSGVLNKIGWRNREAAWDTNFIYTYFYLSKNNSIHIGGGKDEGAISEKEPSIRKKNKVKGYYEGYIDSMFPASGIKIKDVDSGVLGLAKDSLPIIGKSKDEGIYFSIASPGLALSFLGGKVISDLITTGKNEYKEFFGPYRNFGRIFRYTKFLPKKAFRFGTNIHLRFK